MPDTNEVERTRWNDPRWASLWPKRERLTGEVTAYVLEAAALRAGERVLDIGCGGGRTSIAAGAAVGLAGSVVGADLSVPLVGLATSRARDAGALNVRFDAVDMQTEPVPGAPFDVAISQFGVMFFDEPVVAFSNIRAQLSKTGRIAFACWQEAERNPWIIGPAIAEFVPPPPELAPGKSPTGPFALADPVRTTDILEAAGFTDVLRTPYELTVDAPQESVLDDDHLSAVGVPEAIRPAAQAALDAHMHRFALGPALSRFPLAFQTFAARVR